VCTILGKPPKGKEHRERTIITSVASIKSLDEECMKLCEEIMQLWKKLMEDPIMKVVEEILGNA
jgi:hypothetical protein